MTSIGISTTEALPMYHYLSGGRVLRIVIPSEFNNFYCIGYDICSIYNMNLPSLKSFTIQQIKRLAEGLNVDGIILEGLGAVSLQSKIVEIKKEIGMPTGIRIAKPINTNADFIIYDHFLDNQTNVELIRFLKGKNSWVELQAYYEIPLTEKFLPIAKVSGERNIPLHIHLLNHMGGKSVKNLYKELIKLNPYTYIHVDLYGEYDTYCPKCNKPVAYREENILKDLEIKNNSCWNCGYGLPFYNIVAKKTDPLFIRVSHGDTIWIDPRSIR
ncbi:MAG: hypothetical protein G5Z43_000925 [Caldisphaeraceae archaeon]|nr:hypothetical protein [Caldisphaeraceae archaeon]